MKFFVIALLTFISLSVSAQWIKKHQPTLSLYSFYATGKVVVPDSLSIRSIGWKRDPDNVNGGFGPIIGYQRIQYSNDGGITFRYSNPVSNFSERHFSDIFSINKDTTFVILTKTQSISTSDSPRSYIYRSVQGVDSFSKVSTDDMFLNEGWGNFVCFFDKKNGCVVGDPNYDTTNKAIGKNFEIYLSPDCGTTWNRVTSNNIPKPLAREYAFNSIAANTYAVVDNTIWFITNYQRVFKSTDRGETWSVSELIPNSPYEYSTASTIAFEDELNGLAGFGTKVYKTTDGGLNWTEIYNSVKQRAAKEFNPANIQYVKGSQGLYLGTNDKLETKVAKSGYGETYYSYDGAEWKLLATTFISGNYDKVSLSAICFTSPTNGWIGGMDATLYKWENKKLPPKLNILSPSAAQVLNQNTENSISWTSSSPDSVNIYYSTNKGVTWVPIIQGLPDTGSYHWKTPIVSSENCAIRIAPVYDTTYYVQTPLFSIKNTTGIDELSASGVTLFPNPTTGIVNIESNYPIRKVTLFDLLGKQVLLSADSIINISELNQGVYILKVESERGTISFKISKEI
jgi:photosystem II stability/assembly factor-like uncharacterized protein